MGIKKKLKRPSNLRAVPAAKPTPKKIQQKPQQLEKMLQESEARFHDLVELSSDWYWEQDEHLRFVSRAGEALDKAGLRVDEGIGKKRWELPYVGVTEQQWAE